ncbi:unnamed protein product [Protopolystoma xenopodis]|uniref:Uncharacterized protein n=1 Tax=Protopolystoma xenopodis TaxID=117903 RepID=A0A3S4ZLJ8_9PLAT|nr:unnamed protein product [Protopolystoma xenopodis]
MNNFNRAHSRSMGLLPTPPPEQQINAGDLHRGCRVHLSNPRFVCPPPTLGSPMACPLTGCADTTC